MLKRRRTEQDNLLDARSSSPSAPEPAPPPKGVARRRRRRGSPLRYLAVAAALLLAVYLAIPRLLNANRMRPVVEERLGRDLGRRVSIGALHYSPMFGGIVADDVSVADDPLFSSTPFLHASRLDLSVKRFPLIFRRAVEITGIAIDEPTITLIRNAGQWNYSAFLATSMTADQGARSVRIRRAILAIRDGAEDPFVLRDLSFQAASFSTSRESAFELTATVEGGGTLKANGRTLPVRWSGGAPLLPVSGLVSMRNIALAESNLTRSLAPALGGQLSFDGSIDSDETRVTLAGNLALAKLKLSSRGEPAKDPLRFVVAADYIRTTNSGTLSRCDAVVDKGAASITGTYTLAGSPGMKLRVAAEGMPVTPVGELSGSAGVPLPPGTKLEDGLASLDLTIEGPLKAPATKGSLILQNTKVMAFNLEERLSAVAGLDALHISRDLPVHDLRGNVEMTPEKVRLIDWRIELPEVGLLTGGGVIDANQTLDLQMMVIRNGVVDKQPIPFVVRGACVSPVFRQPGKS
jgi:AsmA protein